MEDSSRRVPTKMFSRKSVDHIFSKTLEAQDFDDVFGGPPRRVLGGRKFSGRDSPSSSLFYHDIFVNPERLNPMCSGRILPELRIPGTGGRRSTEFHGDVFGEGMWSSVSGSMNMKNSKTMSNSASVLSYDNCSPYRPPVSDVDDDADVFSVLASKLRSKYVPSKVNARSVMHDVQEAQDSVSKFSSTQPSFVEKQLFGSGKTDSFKSTNFRFSQRVTSPEIISQSPYSYGSAKLSVEDLDLNSPSSVQSPYFREQEAKVVEIQDKCLQEEEENDEDEDDDDDDGDEIMSSYVIKINSDHKEETAEPQDLEEAIAWAKEKFQSHSSPEDQSIKQKEKGLKQNEKEVSDGSPVSFHNLDGQIDGCGSLHLHEKKMALLEEDVRLWSSGKEKNIQLLLATLDYILCPSSGWYPVQLTNLNTSANVKKAYQKARLCLHPDKMQQRGANFAQKYVAEKAFPILQEAWAAFISQRVMPSTRG